MTPTIGLVFRVSGAGVAAADRLRQLLLDLAPSDVVVVVESVAEVPVDPAVVTAYTRVLAELRTSEAYPGSEFGRVIVTAGVEWPVIAARVRGLPATHAVLLDERDDPEPHWVSWVRATVAAFPRVSAWNLPLRTRWFDGHVVDGGNTFRPTIVRIEDLRAIGAGGALDVKGAHVTIAGAPVLERDAFVSAHSARAVVLGMVGEGAHARVAAQSFLDAWMQADERVLEAVRSGAEAERLVAEAAVRTVGDAWMLLTRGAAPSFYWKFGTLIGTTRAPHA